MPKRPRLSERNANVKTNNAEENSTSRERRRTTPSEPKKTKSEEPSRLKREPPRKLSRPRLMPSRLSKMLSLLRRLKLLKLKPLLLNPSSKRRSSKKLKLLRKPPPLKKKLPFNKKKLRNNLRQRKEVKEYANKLRLPRKPKPLLSTPKVVPPESPRTKAPRREARDKDNNGELRPRSASPKSKKLLPRRSAKRWLRPS